MAPQAGFLNLDPGCYGEVGRKGLSRLFALYFRCVAVVAADAVFRML